MYDYLSDLTLMQFSTYLYPNGINSTIQQFHSSLSIYRFLHFDPLVDINILKSNYPTVFKNDNLDREHDVSQGL